MITIDKRAPNHFNSLGVGSTFYWTVNGHELALIKIRPVTGMDAFVCDYNAVELRNGALHCVPGLEITEPFNAKLTHV
jgi:hypothetical protein